MRLPEQRRIAKSGKTVFCKEVFLLFLPLSPSMSLVGIISHQVEKKLSPLSFPLLFLIRFCCLKMARRCPWRNSGQKGAKSVGSVLNRENADKAAPPPFLLFPSSAGEVEKEERRARG